MMDIGLEVVRNNIEQEILDITQSLGILCRVFCRVKDEMSLRNKIESKGQDYYSKDGKKVQDIIGVRVVLYFYEDVDILWNIFNKKMIVVDVSKSDDSIECFTVQRKNMVCKMSNKESQYLYECAQKNSLLEIVDNTFEIQFRTVFSEGWHEIDHLLKYKCKKEWIDLDSESRTFNGIYATLETSDRALQSLFDDIAHIHYRHKNWEAMLRMKYKLEFENKSLSRNIIEIFNQYPNIAKEIYRSNRRKLLDTLSASKLYLKITFDNVVFMANRISVNSPLILKMEPTNIAIDLNNHFGTCSKNSI